MNRYFATTPKGLELLLVEELKHLGASDVAEKLAGVTFTGDLAVGYKACLWSRLANRILLRLTEFPAKTPEQLYQGIQSIKWDEHLNPEGSLHVNFVSANSEINHTLFGAQKVKDAIVDQFREKYAARPDVAREKPDLAVNVYLHRNIATVSIDLSGESLHRRDYRLEQVAAPLKENLAAAILLRANWPTIAKEGGTLVDPMCGSGTFLVEAALIAGDIAPGLQRDYFGFLKWKKHDAALWESIKQDALARREAGKNTIPTILGFDQDPFAIKTSFANIERAGMLGRIHVEKHELADFRVKTELKPGLVIVNPPYGERLGELEELKKLYARFGAKLKQDFTGWQAGVFTGNPELGKNMGIRSHRYYSLFNGAIPCQLLLFQVIPEKFVERNPLADNERRIRTAERTITEKEREQAQAFVNRVQKRLKHLKRWAERENVLFYRVYDADLPEFAVSIDLYQQSALVKAYPIPRNANQDRAKQRLQMILAVLPHALSLEAKDIFFQETESALLPEGFPEVAAQLVIPRQ